MSGLNLTHHCNPNYSLTVLKAFNLTYSISAMVTFLLTTGILVAMIFYKAYHSTLKRLFIYLILSTMVYLANSSSNIQLYWPDFFENTGETFCRWTGYLQTCTFIISQILSLEIAMYLLFVVHYQVKQKPIPVPTRLQTVVLEVVLLLLAVVVPTSLLAIPFRKYGVNAAICWFTLYNESCGKPYFHLGVSFFATYTILIFINMLVFGVLIGIFIRLGRKFEQSRAQYKQTARRTVILLLILVFYAAVHLSSIVVPYLVINKKIHHWEVLFINCVFSPLAQLFRPLAYMFYFNSVKTFRWEETKMAAVEWRRSWNHFRHRCCCCLWGKGDMVLINDLDGRSCENITPSALTSTQYESLGRTSVE